MLGQMLQRCPRRIDLEEAIRTQLVNKGLEVRHLGGQWLPVVAVVEFGVDHSIRACALEATI
jgi:hypothetical protein